MKLKKAFTLAEVLVTLSIIAVIAMLTIPALVKNYKNKLYAASIEKAYSQLSDAIQNVVNDEMATSFSKTTAGVAPDQESSCAETSKGVCWFMRNYLKVIPEMVDCTTNKYNELYNTNYGVCVADEYYTPNGDGPMTHYGSCVQTTSGATVCMSFDPSNGGIAVFIDTNGIGQPNMTGIDAFVMRVDLATNALVDWSPDPASCNTLYDESVTHALKYGPGCLTKVMNAGWKIED